MKRVVMAADLEAPHWLINMASCLQNQTTTALELPTCQGVGIIQHYSMRKPASHLKASLFHWAPWIWEQPVLPPHSDRYCVLLVEVCLSHQQSLRELYSLGISGMTDLLFWNTTYNSIGPGDPFNTEEDAQRGP